jgi:3D (Asp-Asp-Asp) domain-containing protein
MALNNFKDQNLGGVPSRWRQGVTRGCLVLMTMALTAASAVLVKERSGQVRPLAAVEIVRAPDRFEKPAVSTVAQTVKAPAEPETSAMVEADEETDSAAAAPPSKPSKPDPLAALAEKLDPQTRELASDPQVRWFDGRPIRPAKQMWMNVSGYSPDERSCGDSADGKTATLHSVYTNGMKLVAADTKVLPFGSLVSVTGYDDGHVVPVLDRGGAIKGNKLDLLFPTDEAARQWGRKKILVTVWEYADGKPAGDPRKAR